jgi:hypothetical protein
VVSGFFTKIERIFPNSQILEKWYEKTDTFSSAPLKLTVYNIILYSQFQAWHGSCYDNMVSIGIFYGEENGKKAEYI